MIFKSNNNSTGTGTTTGGGLFGNTNTNGNTGGGLFGNSSSNNNTGSGNGGGLFGGSNNNTSSGGGLFGGSNYNSNGNNNTNDNGGNFNTNDYNKNLFTGHGLFKPATATGTTGGGLFASGSNNQPSESFQAPDYQGVGYGGGLPGYGASAFYNSNFMNSFSQLQKGLSETNAYSMVKNNALFNEVRDESEYTDEEKLKKHRIDSLNFMQQMPRNWKFDMNHQNPYQKKKVKDLPQPFQELIVKMNVQLKTNKKKLDQIKENSDSLKKTLERQLREMMDSNILSLKQINNQICRVTLGLKGYTEEVRYFSGIVGQIEKFCDFYKQGNIPTYVIPSENVRVVLSRMEERLTSIQKNIEMLKELVQSEAASGIPDNQIQ